MSAVRIDGATIASVPPPSRATAQRPAGPFRLAEAQSTPPVAPASSLDAFRKGDITREQYIDAKVAHVMEHLGDLPAAPRAFIASELRARLASGDLAHLLPGAAGP